MITILLPYLFLALLPFVHAAQTFTRVELFGNHSLKYYYMSFFVGNPLQPQKLLIDTGSFLTVLPCHNCKVCDQNRLEQLYNPEKSFSSVKMTCKSRAEVCKDRCKLKTEYCDFYVGYEDSSNVIGRVIDDQMSFQPATSESFRGYFGCVDFEKEANQLIANGIIGLGPKVSDNIIYKWFDAAPGRESQFSVCLGVNGGVFELGKPRTNEEYDVIVRAQKRSHFSIGDITAIKYSKANLLNKEAYRKYGYLLDTGSTVSYFPTAQHQMFIEQFQAVCKRMRKNCLLNEQLEGKGCFAYNFTRKTKDQHIKLAQLDSKFPPIELQIDDQTIFWYPRNQFFIGYQDPRFGALVCTAIKTDPTMEYYLLGDNFLRERKILFNLAEQTISFKDNQTCKYEPLQTVDTRTPFYLAVMEKATAIINQYGLYIGAGLVVIYLALRSKINAAFTALMSRVFNRGQQNQLQEQSISETIQQEAAQKVSVVTSYVGDNKSSNCEIADGQ